MFFFALQSGTSSFKYFRTVMAIKPTNLFVCFLGESKAHQSAFSFIWPLALYQQRKWAAPLTIFRPNCKFSFLSNVSQFCIYQIQFYSRNWQSWMISRIFWSVCTVWKLTSSIQLLSLTYQIDILVRNHVKLRRVINSRRGFSKGTVLCGGY